MLAAYVVEFGPVGVEVDVEGGDAGLGEAAVRLTLACLAVN